MIRITLLVALLASMALEPKSPAAIQPASSPADPAKKLFDELSAMDRALFDAVFNTCDFKKLEELVSADFEFLHDRGGLVATNGTQFVENIRNMCERRKSGQEPPSRRELVSMEVFPLANFGAIQTGVHRFYILEPGKPERAGDTAKFTHVWKKIEGQWKIARVLSYDHK